MSAHTKNDWHGILSQIESSLIDSRLLIVESNPDTLSYLEKLFSGQYNTLICTTGKDAIHKISLFQPQIIIVNKQLADMEGLTLCQTLKENADTSPIPVIMITKVYKDVATLQLFASGAFDVICKPFDPSILRFKIANLLRHQMSWENKTLAEHKRLNIKSVHTENDCKFLDHLIRFIENNLNNPDLCVTMVCKEMAASQTLFYHRITSLTGQTPSAFIRNIRLKKAANLLLTGKHKIADVATMAGFENPKHFYKVFKHYYKVSPKKYLHPK